VYLEQYKNLKNNSKDITSRLKKLYSELFDKKFPEKFDGLDIIKTLEHAAGKYNIRFIIYNNNENDRLNHLNPIGSGEKYIIY
jgi:transcription antitermination factor NusA-like protein